MEYRIMTNGVSYQVESRKEGETSRGMKWDWYIETKHLPYLWMAKFVVWIERRDDRIREKKYQRYMKKHGGEWRPIK